MARIIGLGVLLLVCLMALPLSAQTISYGNDYSKLRYTPTSGAFMPTPPLTSWMPNFNLTSIMPRVSFPTWPPRIGVSQIPQTSFVPGAQIPKK